MATDHRKLEIFAREAKIFFDALNGNTSDAAYMLKELSAQNAIEHLNKYHATIQINMLKASQAFRNMRKIAGIGEETLDVPPTDTLPLP